MKTENKTKTIFTALLLTTAIQAYPQASFAQTPTSKIRTVEGSGSSNGSGNRDALSYTQELSPEVVSQKTLDEAFAEMKKSIQNLMIITIPNYAGAGDDFWNNLSPSAIQLLKDTNTAMIKRVETAMVNLDMLKSTTSSELGVIAAFIKEKQNYEAQGLKKEWKNKINSLKKSLSYQTQIKFTEAIESMFELTDRPYSNYYGIVREVTALPFASCDSAICMNLMKDLATKFNMFLQKIKNQRITIPGVVVSKKLKRYWDSPSGINFKHARIDSSINNNQYHYIQALTNLNEKIIREQANKKQNP